MIKLLGDLDNYCNKALSDWNVPGLGIAVIVGSETVFSKGYGFRDLDKKLPFTTDTIFPIASNTKPFTALAAGFLVEDGLLEWDRPIREAVPSVRFSSDALNSSVSLRDMLAHRTGINRHDSMWLHSTFSRKDIFDRLRYMQPSDPLRQNFVYNNVMYCAVGHIIELLTGESWEALVQRRLLNPVGMPSTCFSMQEVYSGNDYAVPYTERRDSTQLFKLPMYEERMALGPAGGLNSNLNDMVRWLAFLMGEGKTGNDQLVPTSLLRKTLEPSMSLPNHMLNIRGFGEVLNCTYGMGCHTAVYRGHLMAFHGGSLGGFYSQVSYLPKQKIGVVTFVIGHHCSVLADLLIYNVYDRLLSLQQVPWSERFLEIVGQNKAAMISGRAKAGRDHVSGTHPSHALKDYVGTFEHSLYPPLKISLKDGLLSLAFRNFVLPLTHVHFDRFDTEDDEVFGKWSVNFSIDPQGEISSLTMALDEAERAFQRVSEPVHATLANLLVGVYATPSGFKVRVVRKELGQLFVVVPGEIDRPLLPYRSLEFRSPAQSNVIYRFELNSGQVNSMVVKNPQGEFSLAKI